MSEPVPRPHFIFIDEGDVSMEWCFGALGSKDAWEVVYCMSPEEPEPYVIVTGPGEEQTVHHGDEARKALADALLRAAKSETGWQWWTPAAPPPEGER